MRNVILILFIGWSLAGNGLAREQVTGPSETGVESPAEGGEMIRSAVVPDPEGVQDVVAEAKAAAAPVPVPPLSHYAALWEKSMFTTRDLPTPELPQGPGFTDQLVLAGIYEVDGAVVAVILDKLSAQISEARIGSENENGIRIKSVSPGEQEGATRIQLQKGMQSGWVSFAEGGTTAGGSETAAATQGITVPGAVMPPQPLIPANAGGMNGGMRDASSLPIPGSAGMGQGVGLGSMVQPLPGGAVDPNLPANPNPVLDEVPLPPP